MIHVFSSKEGPVGNAIVCLFVLRLQVKHLIQALPENRLATLLAQEKFLEAELLAKKFNLDAEVRIYKHLHQKIPLGLSEGSV